MEPWCKRFRASPPPAPDDARKRYLDTVPDDSLRIILRYSSRRPKHHNWHAYVSPCLVNTALDVGGALARAASLEFQSIGGTDGIALDADDDASILRPLVHRLPLRRLVLELPGEDVLPGLLRRCGAGLRELVLDAGWTVVTKTDILAISTRCTKLSYLAIHGNHVAGTLTPIWRALGSTLTRIYIGWYFSAFGHGILGTISVPDLVEHCVNLRRVDVLSLTHAIADVLVALGSRIRFLSVEDELVINTAPWREVCRACTNLEAVHLKLHRSAKAVDVLSLMRARLVSLTLHNPMPVEDGFFSVLSACSALKEVELHLWKTFPEALIRKLFESLASATALTCILSLSEAKPNKDIIDVIACNVTNIESFTISTYKSLEGEDVNALVGLPRLKSVTLRQLFSEKSVAKPPEVCAVEVVKRLKDCAQLVRLVIEDSNIESQSHLIAEAAVTYGRKDFDMFISGVQYRTW